MQIQVYSFRDVILAFVSVVASLFISVSNAGAIQVQEDEIREAIESIKGVQPGGKAHDQAIKAMQVLSRAKARAGGQHWTTPLVAGNYMYLFAQDGNASVLKLDGDVDDANQRVIHRHEFKGEVFLGSPAATGDAIYMRSDKYLYKFAKEPA